jgi:hypothetical protein
MVVPEPKVTACVTSFGTAQDLAEKMRDYRHPWRRATVSEVERAHRNVTIMELLTLVLILRVSVEELLDPSGPGGRGGRLALGFPTFSHDNRRAYFAVVPEETASLICTHAPNAEVDRAPRRLDELEPDFVMGELPSGEPDWETP